MMPNHPLPRLQPEVPMIMAGKQLRAGRRRGPEHVAPRRPRRSIWNSANKCWPNTRAVRASLPPRCGRSSGAGDCFQGPFRQKRADGSQGRRPRHPDVRAARRGAELVLNNSWTPQAACCRCEGERENFVRMARTDALTDATPMPLPRRRRKIPCQNSRPTLRCDA